MWFPNFDVSDFPVFMTGRVTGFPTSHGIRNPTWALQGIRLMERLSKTFWATYRQLILTLNLLNLFLAGYVCLTSLLSIYQYLLNLRFQELLVFMQWRVLSAHDAHWLHTCTTFGDTFDGLQCETTETVVRLVSKINKILLHRVWAADKRFELNAGQIHLVWDLPFD